MRFDIGERPVSVPTRERRASPERSRKAMCESLSSSAKKVASLAAFLASANGIAGCGVAHAVRADRWEAVGLGRPEKGFPPNAEMIRTLQAETGQALVHAEIQNRRRTKAELARREGRTDSVRIEGFDAVELDPELVREYVESGFPKSWSRAANLGRIAITPKELRIPYPGLEDRTEFAHADIPADGGPAKILVTSTQFEKEEPDGHIMSLFNRTMSHELAHVNDYGASPDLTPQEALQLQYLVFERSRAEGRPKFAYPEGIAHPKDAARATGGRMREYFAETLMTALEHGGTTVNPIDDWTEWSETLADALRTEHRASSEEAVRNVGMIRWYLERVDPTFKPWVAERERKRVLGELFSKTMHLRMMNVASRLGDEGLRNLLRGLMENVVPEPVAATKRAEALSAVQTQLSAVRLLVEGRLSTEDRELFDAWETLILDFAMAREARRVGSPEGIFLKKPKQMLERWNAGWTALSEAKKSSLRKVFAEHATAAFSPSGANAEDE